jgi:hypothetical protein
VLQQLGPAHSQPSVSGAVAALQSEKFAEHVYVHEVPVQESAVALVAWQTTLQPPQLVVVLVAVSQPSVSGGVLALQSA